jgi:hypothetical protein
MLSVKIFLIGDNRMGKELIAAIKLKLASMQKIEAAGFPDQTKAAAYFQEKLTKL